MGFGRRSAGIAGLLAATTLCAAPPASATITTTNVTSPPDRTFTTSPSTPDVLGTSDGTTGDQVDVRCYEGTDDPIGLSVASNVAVASDGSFGLFQDDLNFVAGRLCILRAVPAGTSPADLNPFSGPRVAIGTAQLSVGYPHASEFDYYVFGQQLTAANDYFSYGACGLCDSYLLDSSLAPTTTTFFGNDWFGLFDGSGTQSEVQVDSADSYSPAIAQEINHFAGGFPPLTSTYSLNHANGDWTIRESDPLVKCPDSPFPPTEKSCPNFVATGVTVNRTITQTQDGHLVYISDSYQSTDGQQHDLNLLPDNEQEFGGNGTSIAYKFPGQGSFSTHSVDESVSFPDSTPAAAYVKVAGSPSGAVDTGQGAIVFDQHSSPARFAEVDPSVSDFEFHQTGLVTASCSPTFGFAYAQDYLSANVENLVGMAINRFKGSPATVCSPSSAGSGVPATGKRTAALKRCKKRAHKKHWSHEQLKKCHKKAKRLPI